MAEIGFKNIVLSIILVGLFFFALLSFGIKLAEDNEASQTLLNDSVINKGYGDLGEQLDQTAGISESSRLSFVKEIPVIGAISFLLISIVATGTKVIGLSTGFINVMLSAIKERFGVDPIIITIIVALFVLTLMFLAWRVYRSGE